MTYRYSLTALADPTRRRIFEALKAGPRSVGRIAARLPVSRPAVSQHLKILKEAGLVSDEISGTRHIYRIDPNGLAQIRRWLDSFWDAALTSFQNEVDRQLENEKEPKS